MTDPAPDGVRRRAFVLIALLGIPWLVVLSDGAVGLVFAWGLLNPDTWHVTTIYAYLFVHTRGLPDYLLAWPVAVALLLAAVMSAIAGRWAREDPRVTGGLLVLVGLSILVTARGIGRPPSVVGLPVGTAAVWVVAWWVYWPRVGSSR